ncbi:hypothetical protein QFZ75_008006 [Streptomyces sp. V3I8]|uniref:hypothetical protein n=1 Tax=Streptomyces sp. V3I8 TaxID=3042279 RepID=UPI0027875EEF|nr:hypothetical protein [Streptomyces sp. V3I8]MDQ1041504.1 hypothetical protein [Streptomyces sp. V3I8]
MTTDRTTMDDVRRVTPQQLTKMTPPQIDRLNACLSGEYERLDGERDREWERLYSAVGEQKEKVGRRQAYLLRRDELEEKARAILAAPPAEPPSHLKRYDFMLTAEKYTARIGEVLGKIDAIGDKVQELNRKVRPKLTEEWDLRGGWSRFFLVNNTNGHIHKTTSPVGCHTLHWNTDIGWLPDLSGLTEADAVKAHGTILCSVCFPSAPVEWTVGKAPADTECPGSRQFVKLDSSMARRMSKFATCPECGKTGVSVSSAWNLRKHDRPEPASAKTDS